MRRLTRIVATAFSLLFGADHELAAQAAGFRLATFASDVTPPFGHPLLGGTTTPPPAHAIDDPLSARGFVLLGDEKPIVFVSIDWCEIRNDAFDRWRDVLAKAAGTDRQHVLVSAIHQHDTPLADLTAQKILDEQGQGDKIIDFDYHEQCVQRTAEALREGLTNAQRITHLGAGRAKVERIASNRRYLGPDRKPRFDRSSMSGGDPAKATAEDGLIDPWLRTISFWDGDRPVCALHTYAVHPMSHWGSGRVTADFPGLVRARRQEDDESIFQIYASGCAGDVTAGKYNDGSASNQRVLQDRLYAAIVSAWNETQRQPLTLIQFRNAALELPIRTSAGYSEADLNLLLEHENPKKRCLAALGLSWLRRQQARQLVDLPAIDFGFAAISLLPGEAYVAYQIAAQELRPDDFILTIGYGESGGGFIPPETAWAEDDGNLHSWCWVGPGAEKILKTGLQEALVGK